MAEPAGIRGAEAPRRVLVGYGEGGFGLKEERAEKVWWDRAGEKGACVGHGGVGRCGIGADRWRKEILVW